MVLVVAKGSPHNLDCVNQIPLIYIQPMVSIIHCRKVPKFTIWGRDNNPCISIVVSRDITKSFKASIHLNTTYITIRKITVGDASGGIYYIKHFPRVSTIAHIYVIKHIILRGFIDQYSSPISFGRLSSSFISVAVSSNGIVVLRGKKDFVLSGSISNECTIDVEIYIIRKLNDCSGLYG